MYYAVIANGKASVCQSHKQLDAITAIYPYPKVRKFRELGEAREWLAANARCSYDTRIKHYGSTSAAGFIGITYKILEHGIDYVLDTSSLGYVYCSPLPGFAVDVRYNTMHVVCNDVKLNDDIIEHHIIAVYRILKLIGPFVDVDITVPDISVYLAMVKYTGRNYNIRKLRDLLSARAGGVSYTVEE